MPLPFDDKQLRVVIELAPFRHEMERKARRVARWMTATLTSIGDAVIATNAHGQISLLNSAAEKLTGWTEKEVAGKPSAEVVRLMNCSTGEALEDPATRALRLGLVVRLDPDNVLITRTGEEGYVDDRYALATRSAAWPLRATCRVCSEATTLRDDIHQCAGTGWRSVAWLLSPSPKHEVLVGKFDDTGRGRRTARFTVTGN